MNEETKPNHTIYFDDAHIEAESRLMPQALRDPYIWLKTFFRDNCKRDVDVLVSRFRDVGVTIDKTNWVRILKGRWRIDTRGLECSPCVAADNLLRSITALQEEKRIELLEGRVPFVETSIFNLIRRFIEKKMRPEWINRLGVIVGPTGLQKTASYKEMAMRNRRIKWLEASDNGSIKELVLRLAFKFGASKHVSYFNARQMLYNNVTGEHCIIIDNMQTMIRSRKEIMKLGKPAEEQPAYQFVRTLQDETGCAVIWSITPENEDQMFDARSVYLEQFEGRAGGRDKNSFLRLPNYSPKKDIVQIAAAMGVKNAEAHGDLLHEVACGRGRIRRFFEVLQEAKFAADSDKKPLTIDYIEDELEERGIDIKR